MFNANKFKSLQKEHPKVEIVVVSKNRPMSDIFEAISAGVKNIGENYVQEASQKYSFIKNTLELKNIKFHCIGHLQSNKIRKAVEIFDCIQTIDSIKTAKKTEEECARINKNMEVMIEINFDDKKHGTKVSEVDDLVNTIRECKHIKLIGFMCVATIKKEKEQFKKMKDLKEKYALEKLSMGMSGDFEEAISAGSTMIRLGSSLFENKT
jgi:PLP dependent protein